MTYTLLILAILVWPFGQLLNFPVPGSVFAIYPLDIMCGLLTLSLIFSGKSRKAMLLDPLAKPLLYFLIAAAFSLLLNIKTAFLGGVEFSLFYLLRLLVYPSAYFAAKLIPVKKLFPYIFLSLSLFSLMGFIQYFFFPDMRFLKLLGYDDHYYRLIGSFFDPNFSGAVFAAFALVFLSVGQWLAAIPALLLLALTFSRASYLVFFIGLVFLFSVQKKWTVLIYLLILGVIVALIPKPFGEGVNLLRTFSIFSRLDSWQSGWDLFIQKPLLGWGYNTLRFINGERYQIDNSYLVIAATTGIVGLIAFLNLLKQILIHTKTLPQKLFILVVLLHSLFNNSLFYIWIYFSFWLCLGIPLKLKGYKES